MEIENAVNQAKKELANRFDFKGSKAEITLEKSEIKLTAEDQFKINTLMEIVIGKLSKRNISMKSVEKAEPDISPLGHARQSIKIKQGIETAVAKEITGFKPVVTDELEASEGAIVLFCDTRAPTSIASIGNCCSKRSAYIRIVRGCCCTLSGG